MIKINNIMFDVTDRCNFRCSHCYKEQEECGTDLSLEYIDKFLQKIEKENICNSIVISGGEPLLYPDIENLLLRLNGKYDIRINTNGYLLEKFIPIFKKIEKLTIQVSMDGYDEECFYKIRNSRSFNKIVENTLQAKKEGLKVFFRTTLTSVTIEEYEKFIELSKKTEIPLIIRPIVNTGEERQKNLIIDYERLTKWYEDVSEKGYSKYTSGNSPLTENSCPILHKDPKISLFTIDNRGNCYPCSLLRGEKFVMGNLKDCTLEELELRLEAVVLALKNIVESESCKKCGFRKQLGDGTCVVSCYFGNKKCLKNKIFDKD